MKKVGILTFHDEPNYGAFLQTYALSESIKLLGYDVEIIDLRIEDNFKYNFFANIFRPIIHSFIFKRSRNKFLNLTKSKYFSSKELRKNLPNCDIFVLGSDQVWNKDITADLKYSYFFDFLSDDKLRLSYASSFGVEEWNFAFDETLNIKKLLNKFTSISVRERSAIKLCDTNLEFKPELVLDPTLLISDYSKLTGNIKKSNRNVICFKFNKDQSFYSFLREFKVKNNYEISILNKTLPIKGIKNIPLPTISKWIKSIAESGIVITDSYHALIFSIIYKKQFIVIPANEKNFSRLSDLLFDLGLEDRIFYSYDEILQNDRWLKLIDYDKVYNVLLKKRTSSFSYLKRELLSIS